MGLGRQGPELTSCYCLGYLHRFAHISKINIAYTVQQALLLWLCGLQLDLRFSLPFVENWRQGREPTK